MLGKAIVFKFGIGGNEEAARLAGIPVKRTKVGVYMLSGLMANKSEIINLKS